MKAKHRSLQRNLLSCALGAALGLATPLALAQSTGATVRGQVERGDAPAASARVTATNVATGLSRSVQTGAGGAYALVGLPPGTYKVEVDAGGETTSRTITLAIGQTANLDLDVGMDTLEAMTVVGYTVAENRTSEIATYVTPKQIEALPQGSRNFLAFADIVPGMIFDTKGDGSTQLRSGAQSANGINVFIDGVGQKNYVLKGGISGQDGSRGNPFPQLAIGEYKVITSNYKAEYDQISSAAVTAVTKSGTNEFEGDVFYDDSGRESWRTATPAEERADKKQPSGEKQYGFAVGGPIIEDRLFYFFTYEAKEFDVPRTVSLGGNLPQGTPIPSDLAGLLGPSSTPFNEDLYFGKLTWQPTDADIWELSVKRREEDEIKDIGGQNTASYGKTNINESTRVDLRWQWTGGDWFNDAHATFEDDTFNPRAITLGPGINIQDPNRGTVLNIGGGQDFQDKGQRGWGLQDDLTFTGWEGHTIKMGAKFKSVEVNAFEQQPFNPQYRVDLVANQGAGNNSLASFVPYEVRFGAPLPGVGDRNIQSTNKQYGIYLQDDWEVNARLTLNLGLRYDYERTPGFEDYVTPANLVAALRGWSNIRNTDYDIEDYISDGDNRDAFDGAFQPRVGFSYDLFEDQRHVIFGGAGRAYDRNLFDYIALEQSKSTYPSYTVQFNTPGHTCTVGQGLCVNWDPAFYDPQRLYALVAANPDLGSEVNLINNDIKVPYSDQFSLGMRNAFEFAGHDWNTSASIVHIRSKDGIIFSLGNRYPDGSFYGPGRTFGGAPFGERIPGFGTLIRADNGVETRLNQLLLWAEKVYTPDSPWGVTFAYTYSDGEENRINAANFDEHYVFDYPNLDDHPWVGSIGVSKHRFVVTGIAEWWGVTFSSKLTVASPVAKDVLNCVAPVPAGIDGCGNGTFEAGYFDDADFRQLDIAAEKVWSFGDDLRVRLRADVFNLTNERNWTGFNTFKGLNGVVFDNFGDHNDDIALPTRTLKLSLGLAW
jgi:outer membrane receptor protein involved in Fe transport